MKARTRLIMVVAAATVAMVISSCSLSVSVEDRLDEFLADLNSSDRSDIYLSFHPTETQDYPAIQNGTFPDWATLFPVGESYVYVGLDTSDPSGVTGQIDGDTVNYDVVFVMALDGSDWQINDLYLDGSLTIK